MSSIPAAQRSALISLYNSTNGDSWTDNSGWKTPPLNIDGFAMPGTEGSWFGIGLGSDDVNDIQLNNNNLNGTIPSEIGNLSDLIGLYLNHNQLTGNIPSELGNLINLTNLCLHENQLTGSIPPEIGNLTIPDSAQDDIKSLNTVVGDGQIGISFRNEPGIISIISIDSIDPMTISDLSRPTTTPLGLFAFCLHVSVPGDEVEVTVHFSEAATDNMVWYMYNPVDGWVDYSEYSTYSQDRMSIVLRLKDGGYGDTDGIKNGIIVDPGGSGIGSFVHGLIYDNTTDQGVEKAEISIEDIKVITLNDGHYKMMMLPGEYPMSVVAPDYETINEIIKITEAFTLEKDFGLTPSTTSNGGGGGGGVCFIDTLRY